MWAVVVSLFEFVEYGAEVKLMVLLGLSLQLHVDGVALEGLLVWRVLHHQQLVSNHLQVIELSWEQGWEVTLDSILLQCDLVGSILGKLWLEVENNTGDLLEASLWLTSGENGNSSVWKGHTTLEMESVDLVRFLLLHQGPSHVRLVLNISDLLEVHDGRFNGQLCVNNESKDCLVLPVDGNVSGDVVTGWDSWSWGPCVGLQVQVLRPSVLLSSQHHYLLLSLLGPKNCSWSHGLVSEGWEWSGLLELEVDVKLDSVADLEHGFVLHWPAVEDSGTSLDHILEVNLSEAEIFSLHGSIGTISDLEESSGLEISLVSLPETKLDVGAATFEHDGGGWLRDLGQNSWHNVVIEVGVELLELDDVDLLEISAHTLKCGLRL